MIGVPVNDVIPNVSFNLLQGYRTLLIATVFNTLLMTVFDEYKLSV